MSPQDYGDENKVEHAEATLEKLRSTPREVSPKDVEECVRALPGYFRGTHPDVEMAGVKGGPDWHGYEMRIWELSEAVREYLKRSRELRGRCGVLDAIADAVKNPRFGKGRQNCVLVLAEYGGSSYASTIAWALGDPQLAGHAVKALARLREPGYSEQIEEILEHSRVSWVRSAARKYLRSVANLS